MPYKIAAADFVEHDIEDALNYYDTISKHLGIRFENDMDEAFDRIEKSPYNYFNLENGYRRIALTHFPYMIIYRIEEELQTVRIVGVLHQHTNPAAVRRRMK